MGTAVYTSDWRSRTKGQLLNDIQIVIEQRDKALERIARIKAFAENLSCEWTAMSTCEHDDCCATSQLRAVIDGRPT